MNAPQIAYLATPRCFVLHRKLHSLLDFLRCHKKIAFVLSSTILGLY